MLYIPGNIIQERNKRLNVPGKLYKEETKSLIYRETLNNEVR